MTGNENVYESISANANDNRLGGLTQDIAQNKRRDIPVQQTKKNELLPQFESKTRNIQLLHQLISSVQSFGDFCLLDISSDGMCFSINDGNVCKVRLNLNRKVFQTYTFNGVWREKNNFSAAQLYAEDTDFSDAEVEEDGTENYVTNSFDCDAVISVNLNIASFLETMNIHVKDRKDAEQRVECTLRYDREGDPFVMVFEDDSIIERCELNTYYIDDLRSKGKKLKKKNRKSKEKKNTTDNIDVIESFDIDNPIIDDSIFRLDSNKILYDIIIKSNILHDIIKDMNDLNTDKFVLYCHKTKGHVANGMNDGNDEKEHRSKLIFISKSKSDTIGFSKLIIPQRKLNIPEFKLFKPVIPETNPEEYEFVDCYDLSLSSTYHFEYFSRLLKAIRLSKLIKIRKDMDGITSLLLLLGKSTHTLNQQQAQRLDNNDLYGSSIEFVTLESISIDELSALTPETRSPTLLSKLGYGNNFVEQLIKDDQDVQTIRVGNDGQLITLDDYFGKDARAEFEEIENVNIHDRDHEGYRGLPMEMDIVGDYMPVEGVHADKTKNRRQDDNILQLTEQLTMSLLGHATPTAINNIEVEQSMVVNDEVESEGDRTRKRLSNYRKEKDTNKRTKNRKTKGRPKKGANGKKKNDGIETVGGAIEIPLFI